MTNENNISTNLEITEQPASNNMEFSNADFGRRLRKLRKDAGITRTQMAETLGMEANSLGLIERGINGMSKKNIVMLNTIYGFDLNYLLTGRYFTGHDILKDVKTSEWLSIYTNCTSDKTDALIAISKQIADNFR